jgi:hypothetical protein
MFPKVEIIHLNEPYVNGVAIDVPARSKPLMVLPFRKGSVRLAESLSSTHILLVGDDHRQILVAVIDVISGEIVRSAEHPRCSQNYSLSADKQRLYGYGGSCGLQIVDTKSLAVTISFDAAVWNGNDGHLIKTRNYYSIDRSIRDRDNRAFHDDELKREFLTFGDYLRFGSRFAELPSGHILISYDHEELVAPSQRPRRWQHGVYEIDVSSGSTRRRNLMQGTVHDQLRGLRIIEPSNQIGICSNLTVLPFSSGTGTPTHHAYGVTIDEVREHKDVLADGTKRFGIALDHWQLGSAEQRPTTHIVRMMSAVEFGYHPASLDMAETALEFEAALFAHGHDPELKKRRPLMWNAFLKRDMPVSIPGSTRDPGSQLYCAVVAMFFEPNGDAYWLCFSDVQLRRVTTTGELGPLIGFERWKSQRAVSATIAFLPGGKIRFALGTSSVCFDPHTLDATARRIVIPESEDGFGPAQCHRDAFRSFVADHTVNTARMRDWSVQACDEALWELAKRIEADMPSMIWGETLRFRFAVAGEITNETEFFQRLLDQQINAVAGLRTLLLTYLDKIGVGGEGRQLWQNGEKGIAALGPALRALVLLDPDALDVFRIYLSKRDGEHEGYCRGTIMPDFVKTHGWRDRKALQFGIYFILNSFWGGFSLNPNEYGLLTAASCMVSAKDFVGMLLGEVFAFNPTPQWSHQNEEGYLASFGAGLDEGDGYQAAVAHELALQRPSLLSSTGS